MAPLMRRESAAIPAMPSPGSLSCRSDTLGCVGTLPCRWCTHWPLQDAGADASGCELWRMMRELRTQQFSFTFWADDLLRHAALVWRPCSLKTPLVNIHILIYALSFSVYNLLVGCTSLRYLLAIPLLVTGINILIYAHVLRNTTEGGRG